MTGEKRRREFLIPNSVTPRQDDDDNDDDDDDDNNDNDYNNAGGLGEFLWDVCADLEHSSWGHLFISALLETIIEMKSERVFHASEEL